MTEHDRAGTREPGDRSDVEGQLRFRRMEVVSMKPSSQGHGSLRLRLLSATGAVAAILLVAACAPREEEGEGKAPPMQSGGLEAGAAAKPAGPREIQVEFKPSAATPFTPERASSRVGDKVTWANHHAEAIVIESGTSKGREGKHDGKFRSPPIPLGERWTHVFDQPGTYPYYVGARPWYHGEVVVTEGPQV